MPIYLPCTGISAQLEIEVVTSRAQAASGLEIRSTINIQRHGLMGKRKISTQHTKSIIFWFLGHARRTKPLCGRGAYDVYNAKMQKMSPGSGLEGGA